MEKGKDFVDDELLTKKTAVPSTSSENSTLYDPIQKRRNSSRKRIKGDQNNVKNDMEPNNVSITNEKP